MTNQKFKKRSQAGQPSCDGTLLKPSLIEVIQKVADENMIDRLDCSAAKIKESTKVTNVQFVIQQCMFGNGAVPERFEKGLDVLFQLSILSHQVFDRRAICIQ